ncbi:MAG: uroporphyrinogen-III synthase [Candidatus Azobacteroides pseudotrichonymphae]|jgi:uroporphyrinogen-III synthase|uniref:Uroporphyrinogen-III synthase n=1 Tax=Azobacteroides pseudotrichonymphae genomovar. CFP2 TaxID=511995 RepID=B6YQH9_AZOPC|nr:uroporphyrinogen-III synthase [Candidatus Azobacteroides pseudotrichonymphae]MDR0530371.1 uroporphyrinogen-III synthase [Bacteroidales bacterium OttesenSCG-928-I14]BAG83451.1 uroporphyrinogen-III synthase [Candidatus Azobacteroides pseudotrichonymphae genomovar. CFP2]GMO36213.1 MAG: uroporphyrinogen-III synthase [Candidatus Azobacteroides pseudotrichonymphae]
MSLKIKKVLVSQPKPATGKSPYYEIAKKYDLQIDFKPFIKIEPISLREFRRQKINIQDYTAIVFTAKIAIDHYFRLCRELRFQIPESLKYFCLSETIAVYLQKYIVYRKRKIFFSELATLEDLIIAICKYDKENFLIPVSNVHGNGLSSLLNKKNIKCSTAVMYRTVSNDFNQDEKFDYDLLLFFAPAGINSLLKNFPDFKRNDVAIGAFGSATAQAVEQAGLRLAIEAPTPEAPSMVTALENYIKKLRKIL